MSRGSLVETQQLIGFFAAEPTARSEFIQPLPVRCMHCTERIHIHGYTLALGTVEFPPRTAGQEEDL